MNPPEPYQLVFLANVLQRLRAMGDRVATRQLRQQLGAILRTVQDRLTHDPVNWGDPVRHLPHSGTLLLSRVYGTLHFTYAVDETNRLVIVNRVRTLSKSPYA